MTEEDRKKRRQEINRQSARRIRERRTHEMENLRLQVCAKPEHSAASEAKYALCTLLCCDNCEAACHSGPKSMPHSFLCPCLALRPG